VKKGLKEKKFLDTEDLSRLWDCHPETVRLMVRHGKLKPIDDRPPFVFKRSEIEKFPKPKVGRPRKSVG